MGSSDGIPHRGPDRSDALLRSSNLDRSRRARDGRHVAAQDCAAGVGLGAGHSNAFRSLEPDNFPSQAGGTVPNRSMRSGPNGCRGFRDRQTLSGRIGPEALEQAEPAIVDAQPCRGSIVACEDECLGDGGRLTALERPRRLTAPVADHAANHPPCIPLRHYEIAVRHLGRENLRVRHAAIVLFRAALVSSSFLTDFSNLR